ncbi:hypothetical protein T484DRAFT_3128379 [Baffinella frigidus]|nr:hypothetical protein T484DRAFT_3128379 [Cryptophyta sp. CCMP2293]
MYKIGAPAFSSGWLMPRAVAHPFLSPPFPTLQLPATETPPPLQNCSPALPTSTSLSREPTSWMWVERCPPSPSLPLPPSLSLILPPPSPSLSLMRGVFIRGNLFSSHFLATIIITQFVFIRNIKAIVQ